MNITPSSTPNSRFTGRVALVTGASRGIGLAIAERILGEGGQVVITARKADGLAEATQHLAAGERVVTVAGHADDDEHQRAAVDAALTHFGRLDVLVNNTGINPAYGPLTELDSAAARKIMDVNVLAALNFTRTALDAGLGKHAAESVPAGATAAVVNISSFAGLHPAPGIAYYGVSKAALIGLTMQLAAELAPRIRVNAVAPAVVKTRFATALFAHDEEGTAASYPLGRLGEPTDVAAAVAFLASDDAAWITGQTLVLDGGSGLRAGL